MSRTIWKLLKVLCLIIQVLDNDADQYWPQDWPLWYSAYQMLTANLMLSITIWASAVPYFNPLNSTFFQHILPPILMRMLWKMLSKDLLKLGYIYHSVHIARHFIIEGHVGLSCPWKMCHFQLLSFLSCFFHNCFVIKSATSFSLSPIFFFLFINERQLSPSHIWPTLPEPCGDEHGQLHFLFPNLLFSYRWLSLFFSKSLWFTEKSWRNLCQQGVCSPPPKTLNLWLFHIVNHRTVSFIHQGTQILPELWLSLNHCCKSSPHQPADSEIKLSKGDKISS